MWLALPSSNQLRKAITLGPGVGLYFRLLRHRESAHTHTYTRWRSIWFGIQRSACLIMEDLFVLQRHLLVRISLGFWQHRERGRTCRLTTFFFSTQFKNCVLSCPECVFFLFSFSPCEHSSFVPFFFPPCKQRQMCVDWDLRFWFN